MITAVTFIIFHGFILPGSSGSFLILWRTRKRHPWSPTKSCKYLCFKWQQTFRTHNGTMGIQWAECRKVRFVLQSYCRVVRGSCLACPVKSLPSRSASFVSKPKTRKYAARVASSSISLRQGVGFHGNVEKICHEEAGESLQQSAGLNSERLTSPDPSSSMVLKQSKGNAG